MATEGNKNVAKSSTNIIEKPQTMYNDDLLNYHICLLAQIPEATNGNENVAKSSKVFECNICKYITDKKCNFDKHILTRKHSLATSSKKVANEYVCNFCEKVYINRTSLWKHKKTCTNINIDKNDEIEELKGFMKYLMQENNELKQMMIETMKTDKNTINSNNSTNNNNNVNSHNKTFNLQFFLNETCKDAMNITDFVDSIKLQLSDLENVGRLGYVNGISKIIIKNLNALDETKRPIHCTDTKREILYVKDEDVWKKDNDNDKKCVKKAIKRVAYKNCKLISEFREKYPDCNKSDSKYSDQYNKMIVEAMGGSGDNDGEKEDKIIQNISKEVQIKKKEQLIL